MIRRLLAAATILLVAAALLIAAWPQLFGLERTAGVAQLVSLRGLAALIAGVGVVALLIIALTSRPLRRLSGILALLLLAFAGLSAAVLATRGYQAGGVETKAAGDLMVLSWNTKGDAPGADRIAKLAVLQKADIVALPETSRPTADAVAALMRQAGNPMQVLSLSNGTVSKARTTSLLISTSLGEYRREDRYGTTPTLPSVIAVPVDGSGPTIIAAHPISPVPGELTAWRAGLAWMAARCAADATSGGGTILAGDLNSTLDHWGGLTTGSGDLGACRDAARTRHSAAVGTWPTSVPTSLGTPIDHVLTSSGWTATRFRVITTEDSAGSDHRPIVAQLRMGG